jgi:hypothetical protein
VARYNGPDNSSDEPNAMVVDASGYVYVTGMSLGSGNYDYATIKYNAVGAQKPFSDYCKIYKMVFEFSSNEFS